MAYVPGPYITPHLYLQWGGKLPGNEQWSCGLRLSPRNTGPWPPEDAAGLIVAAKTAIQAFHSRVGTLIDSRALLSFVKLNMVDTDGTYMLDTTNQQVLADIPGGGGAGTMPNQVAIAVSTETGYSRGPAHRGRFYLPLPMAVTQPDGLITAGDAGSIKTSCATLLTALNALSVKYIVAVHSRKLGSPTQRAVTAFSVGRVLDTQRRRRRSLLENRV